MGEVVQEVVDGGPESPVALAAQRYAEKCGWHLLPMGEVGEAGLGAASATSDVATLREWFRERPSANLGWVPSRSGAVVFSIDSSSGGQATFRQLASGPLPDTIEWVESPWQGHIAFTVDDPSEFGNNRRSLGPGVELVVGNAAVAVPPSISPGGRHHWARSPFVQEVTRMPGWLKEKLCILLQGGDLPIAGLPADPGLPPLEVRSRRAARYLQSVLPSGADFGWQDALVGAIPNVVRGIGLPEDQALALLAREFDERGRDGHTGDPSDWDRDALRAVIQNAVEEGQVGWGSLLDRWLP